MNVIPSCSVISGFHYLHHRKIIKCKNNRDMRKSDDFKRRKIRHTYVGDFHISTVFLTIDHSMLAGYPSLFFETMVFVDTELEHKLQNYMLRSHDHRGALKTHRAVVKLVKQFIKQRN